MTCIIAIQMVLFNQTYMYTSKTKLYENIDTWMDNHDDVNQYTRTDLMQTKALIIFVCVSVHDRTMSISILF